MHDACRIDISGKFRTQSNLAFATNPWLISS